MFVPQSRRALFFDHADIYRDGACEEIFANVLPMRTAIREKIILQSTCGVRTGIAFDFSKEHILASVDGSLRRLQTDYLDVLLLHRPDALVEPEEVAEAFDTLQTAGKVRHFGVSNHSPMQIQLLQKGVKQPLVASQLQLSITNATMITRGLHLNMPMIPPWTGMAACWISAACTILPFSHGLPFSSAFLKAYSSAVRTIRS